MTTREDILSLAPCPFCNDPMENSVSIIRHVHQGDCIIGQLAYDETKRGRWNNRAARTPPAATQWGDSGPIPGVDFGDEFDAAPTPPAAEYEECADCGGSGLALNMAGEPDECRACHGNTVVPVAAEAPGQEPVVAKEELAKLLWERFAPDHEVDWPSSDAAKYRSVAEDIFRSALVSAPPTYADTEAKGFERVDWQWRWRHPTTSPDWSHWAYGRSPLFGNNGYEAEERPIYAAIRSLASPAKEPGQ